ncbi:hypothetical protein E3E12_03715 [Formicincola oecophyllae]|uniref:Transporter n=1 Tax=Formicincola oecophyllae TaxID=2558361 RepID=A0A4Y6U8E4_9PROT|nr:hypothetical protein [Formicincola oecophyllae]QDH13454.1 hypothetical protein E3E12_03715 [Formicincola oecophyllae]
MKTPSTTFRPLRSASATLSTLSALKARKVRNRLPTLLACLTGTGLGGLYGIPTPANASGILPAAAGTTATVLPQATTSHVVAGAGRTANTGPVIRLGHHGTAAPEKGATLVPARQTPAAPPPAEPEQWYTGSLASPSPALPAPGLWGFEPYFSGTVPLGQFADTGKRVTKKGKGGPNGFSQFTLSEYSITNHLTFYMLPTYSYSWGNGTHHSSGLRINDLPMEFKYRIGEHYSPSLTISIGANAPVGKYQKLHNSQEGVGTGAWIARFGVETQLVFPFFNHMQRIRGWAMAREPFTSTSVKGMSVYGTQNGFEGTGHAAAFGNEGVSWEGGLTREWLLALDLYHVWSAGTRYTGHYTSRAAGIAAGFANYHGQHIHSRHTPWGTQFRVAPAIEYNWTPAWGAIMGVDLPVMGHNMSANISPQAAVFYTF